MIKDLLGIREIYNDLFWLRKSINMYNINTKPIDKSIRRWQGQWGVKFSTFLRQVGRKK